MGCALENTARLIGLQVCPRNALKESPLEPDVANLLLWDGGSYHLF